MRRSAAGLILLAVWTAFLSGQDIPSVDAAKGAEILKNPGTYLVDVRSVAEYVFVGHAPQAYNIPLSFWSETEQKLVPNERFLQDLRSRFKASDVLVFICRSGGRSLRAAQAALEAGFKSVVNVNEGFEGRKDEKGHFSVGGWKGSGLPYTYDVDPEYAYKPAKT